MASATPQLRLLTCCFLMTFGAFRFAPAEPKRAIFHVGSIDPSTWEYTLKDPEDESWPELKYDTEGWKKGRTPIGENSNFKDVTMHTKWPGKGSSIWMRRPFRVSSAPQKLIVRGVYCRSLTVYLNGRMVHEKQGQTARAFSFALEDPKQYLRPGTNVLAVKAQKKDFTGHIDVGVYEVLTDKTARRIYGTPLIPRGISQEVSWSYFGDQPPADWASPEFNDTEWKRGSTPFASRSQKMGEPKTKLDNRRHTFHLRRNFAIRKRPKALKLDIACRKEPKIFLNGKLVWSTKEDTKETYRWVVLRDSDLSALRPGKNLLAVEFTKAGNDTWFDLGLWADWGRTLTPDLLVEAGGPEGRETRMWTAANGRQVRARLVSVEGDRVTLVREEGKPFQLSKHQLSSEDQAWLEARNASPIESELREWKTLDGQKFKARLTGRRGEQFILTTESGEVRILSPDILERFN